MRKLLGSLVIAVLGWGPMASAQSSVVVVELYTSQGCSSCPAADAILSEIAGDPKVIALGMHVDYWDYLGWKDQLAQHDFTLRQTAYNAALKSRYRLVTPQVFIQGQDYVAGAKRGKILEYIKMMRDIPEGAKLEITRKGGVVAISLEPRNGRSKVSDLHIVRFTPEVSVRIRAGENAGKTIRYTNAVTSWETVAKWNGHDRIDLSQRVQEGQRLAVIVQAEGNGPILAARQLDW